MARVWEAFDNEMLCCFPVVLFHQNLFLSVSETFGTVVFVFFFGGGLPHSIGLFLWTALPLCNMVSRMMKANSMIHLLLRMSEEREVAEGRFRTLGALTVRQWELLLRV